MQGRRSRGIRNRAAAHVFGVEMGLEHAWLGLELPCYLYFPVLRDAVTEIQIDQALIWNTRFIRHTLEVADNVFGKTHGDGLLEF